MHLHWLDLSSLALLGRSRLEDMSRYFRGPRVQLRSQDAVFILLGLAGLILAIWLLSLVVQWQEQGRKKPSATRLFLQLCRAHRLKWRDGWLLWRLAISQRLTDPARVFLEPERFEPEHLMGTLRFHAARFQMLRGKLFSRPERTPPPDGRDPSWNLPAQDRQGTPLAPVTPTPQIR